MPANVGLCLQCHIKVGRGRKCGGYLILPAGVGGRGRSIGPVVRRQPILLPVPGLAFFETAVVP